MLTRTSDVNGQGKYGIQMEGAVVKVAMKGTDSERHEGIM